MQTEDEDLIAAVIAEGDRRAFSVLVTRHQSAVRGLLRRLTRNASDADDLAQETFIKAFEKIADYSGKGRFKAWLCRIAYTQFLMAARKRRSTDRMIEAYEAEPADTVQAPQDGTAKVDLDRALTILGEDERNCVILCYAGGMSHGEAAEATGLPLGTVKSHVNRGKAKLKAWFEQEEVAA